MDELCDELLVDSAVHFFSELLGGSAVHFFAERRGDVARGELRSISFSSIRSRTFFSLFSERSDVSLI